MLIGQPRSEGQEQQWYRWNQGVITARVAGASAAEMGVNSSYSHVCLISLCRLLQSWLLLLISSDLCLDTALAPLPFPLPFTKHPKFLPHRTPCSSHICVRLFPAWAFVHTISSDGTCFPSSFGEQWFFLEDFVQKLLPQLSPPFLSWSCPLGLGLWKLQDIF